MLDRWIGRQGVSSVGRGRATAPLDLQPEIHLLGLTLQTFGLMFGLGFIAAGAVLARRLKELSLTPDWAYEIIFAGLVGGFVGARLWFIVDDWDDAKDDLLGSVFSGTGLVWYGGAIGGALAVIGWARWRQMDGVTLIDMCAPALALGYAIGRVGCQLSGDGDYGEPSDLPWAMAYPEGTVATTDEVHPTPIYETLAMGLAALGLWRLRDRLRPTGVFGLYLALAGLERFLVEFVRRNEPSFAGLTTAQLVSLAMIAVGGAMLARLARAGGLRANPAAT